MRPLVSAVEAVPGSLHMDRCKNLLPPTKVKKPPLMFQRFALRYWSDINPNALKLMLALIFLSFLTMGVSGVTGVLFVLRLGLGTEFLGMYNFAGALGHLSTPLPASFLVRHLGLKRSMILGVVVVLAGFWLTASVEFFPHQAWTAYLMGSQFLTSCGFAIFLVNCTPAVMAATDNQNRTKTYGLYSAARNFGSLAGMLAGGMLPALMARQMQLALSSPQPFRLSLMASTLSAIVSLFVLSRYGEVDEPQTSQSERSWSTFPVLPVALSLLTVVLSQGAVAVCYSFCNAYMDVELSLSPQFIGTLGALGQLCAVVVPLAVPQLRRRLDNGTVMVLVSLGAALMLVPFIATEHWLGAGLGRTGIMSMAAIWMPVAQMYQMELVPSTWRPTAYAMFSMSLSVNYGLVSLFGGYLISAWGFPILFLVSCLTTLLGCLILVVVIRRPIMQK